MFKPRHAYRSPITNRYRGKAKGCPVFNNITDINSSMVEQHDECLECLAKIKNRTDLYRTLADNNKPSNNVIKSLQRLSSSASNNRLKTCLQFLIIRVNEKTISTPPNHQQQSNGINTSEDISSQIKTEETTTTTITSIKQEANSHQADQTITTSPPTALATTTKLQNNSKRLRLLNQKQKQQKHKHNQQLASPPQDQVSSTQDQLVPTTTTTTSATTSTTTNSNHDEHDCQTSPLMLVTTQTSDDDEHRSEKQFQDSPIVTVNHVVSGDSGGNDNAEVEQEDVEDEEIEHTSSPAQTQSSPPLNYALKTTATTTTNTSPPHRHHQPQQQQQQQNHINHHHQRIVSVDCATSSKTSSTMTSTTTTTSTTTNVATKRNSISDGSSSTQRRQTASKRRKIHNSSDHDTSSTASWSSTSYASPPSPLSTSSTSSISSSSSRSSSSSCSSASSASSSCSSSSSSRSPSPLSSPDIINELKGPRLKLSEEKIRKIKKRPIIFDDYYTEHSFASTPTTSSGCSPGQHSNTTQNSDCSRLCGMSSNNLVVHMFQAPPKFVNNLNLKTCNLPTKLEQPSPAKTPPVPTKEMLNCAICGIKDRQPNISKIYGQNSCLICTRFFTAFLKRPQQLFCAQDGDCLMTFDSRCQACWIKICLQKLDIDEKDRKTASKYSPKLLSSPQVSLITIDTNITR